MKVPISSRVNTSLASWGWFPLEVWVSCVKGLSSAGPANFWDLLLLSGHVPALLSTLYFPQPLVARVQERALTHRPMPASWQLKGAGTLLSETSPPFTKRQAGRYCGSY